jgi:predicted RNA-binding Zn-ribbon protein involved in translation (DUF1610 family)
MGRSTKYTDEMLEHAVRESSSIAGVLRVLGVTWSGGSHAHISRRIKRLGLDTTHFTGAAHMRGKKPALRRLTAEEVLVVRPAGSRRTQPYLLRRALVEVGVPYRCAHCGIGGSWRGKPLILHVDHINGDCLDSRVENLRFLCPNCHTQTATWAGRNASRISYRSAPTDGRLSTAGLDGTVEARPQVRGP